MAYAIKIILYRCDEDTTDEEVLDNADAADLIELESQALVMQSLHEAASTYHTICG